MQYYFSIFIFISTSLSQVKGICTLNAIQINDTSRVYLTFSGGHWTLLTKDVFQTNEEFYLLCPGAQRVTVRCTAAGTFDQNLPIVGRCPTPLRASIAGDIEPECTVLGGDLYKVGYFINNDFLEIYRVCFDVTSIRAWYSRHQVHSFEVPGSYFQRSPFTTDRIVTGASKAALSMAAVFNRSTQLLGNRQNFVLNANDLVIERGHMVPIMDFLSYDQKRETMKMINVAPEFSGPNRANWNRIENWIKSVATQSTLPVTVVTGTYGVMQLPHSTRRTMIDMYLQDGNKSPIPRWMYKVVRHGRRCYVFVTNNNQFRQGSQGTMCNNPVNCPAGITFSNAVGDGHSYCCNYAQFVAAVGNHANIC